MLFRSQQAEAIGRGLAGARRGEGAERELTERDGHQIDGCQANPQGGSAPKGRPIWCRQWHRELFRRKRETCEGEVGGPDRDRTGDLLNAIQARSQLRYRPLFLRLLRTNLTPYGTRTARPAQLGPTRAVTLDVTPQAYTGCVDKTRKP